MPLNQQRISALAVSFVIACCAACTAMGASTEYLAELQLLGVDEFIAGQVAGLRVKVTNRGSLTWPPVANDPVHPVRLSYHWLDADGNVVTHDGLRTELPQELARGESLLLRASILAPPIPGRYTLVLDLLQEQITWFAARGSPPLKLSALEVHRAGALTWQRGRILFIVAGAFLLLFLMGLGTTRLLAPDLPMVLIPLMGVSSTVALCYYASLLGMSLHQAKWGILAMGAGATVAAIFIPRSTVPSRRRENVWLTLLTAMMLLVTLFPLWDFGRPSSAQNTYAAFFVTMSEYWKGHGLHELPALDSYQPLDYLVRERLLHNYVDAPSMLNAFIASMFGLDSYETHGILTALLLAMLPATLYWVARTAFHLAPWSSAVATSLAVLNISYHRWSFLGQLTFIAGLLFLVFAVGAGAVLLERRARMWFAALALSTLLAVYPALFPYAVVTLLCYGVLLLWQKTLSLRGLGLTYLKVLGLMILINPVIMYYLAVSGLSAAGQMRQDWRNIAGYPALPELLGLVPHFSGEVGRSWVGVLALGLALLIVGISGYGLFRAWKDGRWLIPATVTPYLLGALVIALVMGHAYGYYKHGVATLFAFLVSFAYGLEGLCRQGGSWRRLIPVLLGGIFLGLNLLAFKTTYARERPVFVPPELAAVGQVKSLVKGGEVVFIAAEVMGLQLWTSYFLWGIPLSVPPAYEAWGWWGFSSVFGRGDPMRFYHPQSTHTLSKWDEIVRPRPEPVWSNATYLVHAGPPTLAIRHGWYELDGGAQPSRWMAQEGTLQALGNNGGQTSVRLSMTLMPIVVPLTLEVFADEERLGAFVAQDTTRPATFLTRPFTPYEAMTLKIRAREGCFEPNRLFGNADHRCLSARFLAVSLVDVAP